VSEQRCTDTLLLMRSAYVRMTNECDVFDLLDSHDTGQRRWAFSVLESVEGHFGFELVLEMLDGHIQSGKAIRGDDSAIGLSAVIDNRVDLMEIGGGTGADHRHRLLAGM
jgi:hypothetical protein